ncbi:MAG: phosphoglycerate kinase [Thermoplasmatales archaeon B_DKE]|nr:MAG: phosphoglycerate kinase [Thermoplasmatales archaeon B_DKE]
MQSFFTMDSFDLRGKTVFLRLDINSPMNPMNGEILGGSRFKSHVDTINSLMDSKVVIVAHQSRPGKEDFTSLEKHAAYMKRVLGRDVKFIDALFGSSVTAAVKSMKIGDILMLENTRFYSEETEIPATDIEAMEGSHIVRSLEPLMDYYVIDAFPAIHRAQTTLVGFRRVKPNIAGRLIEKEVAMLDRFSHGKERPKLAILAGSKIDDSIAVSKNFLEKKMVDSIIVGGVVANAFLWASGKNIGKKNMEFIMKNNKNYESLLKDCSGILKNHRDRVVIPVDFVLNPSGRRISVDDEVPDDELLADIGVDSIVMFTEHIRQAKAIFMNGPMGMYEMPAYSSGTFEVLNAISRSRALRIAGGGHTLSAMEKLGMLNRIDHASTGGGALISYLSGEAMPVLEALSESRALFKGN